MGKIQTYESELIREHYLLLIKIYEGERSLAVKAYNFQ